MAIIYVIKYVVYYVVVNIYLIKCNFCALVTLDGKWSWVEMLRSHLFSGFVYFVNVWTHAINICEIVQLQLPSMSRDIDGSCNWTISQIPQCTCPISRNAPFRTEYTHFYSEWCIVGYGTGALWDLWDWSVAINTTIIKLTDCQLVRTLSFTNISYSHRQN